jgi:HAD superfamily hydrolase (TIGR01459 family)
LPNHERPPILAGLHAIASRYDVFYVDLWGVIHDGSRPFHGALEALQALAEAGRSVVFITNSSRTGAQVRELLAEMGVGPELYTALISSGDVTREALLARDASLFASVPEYPRCLHVGDPNFVPWLFELGLDFVADIAHAELILATGGAANETELKKARERLAPAAARRIPMVCTNPDKLVPTAAGLTLGPGAVAASYAALGAPVFLYGKPHAPIYLAAHGARPSANTKRVVAIGDSLDTDIRGAREAGIDCVLVTHTGIHAAELQAGPKAAKLASLFNRIRSV